jgi:tetratricopeptide (TPR) repeat protein
MFGILTLIGLGLLVIFYQQSIIDVSRERPSRLAAQLDKLWDIAQASLREKKYLRAEKALLTILRVDERNARAYNRLGILYAKQHQYDDAIECFEIAQSLQPSASSLHNVGLIYYETGKYDKAAQAFEQALEIESDVAARHIAYAKVLEATGHKKKMIEQLEHAVELDPNPQSVGILADALEREGETERADKLHLIAQKMAERGKRTRIKQPRKVNV